MLSCCRPVAGRRLSFGSARSERADAPTVLFYNHYDVQPAEPIDLWDSDPFVLTIREDKAYARGVADDKGHITSRLLALGAVRAANGGRLPFHVKFVAEGEERSGAPPPGTFVEQNKDLLSADACIWEEGGVDESGKPTLYCGMRGIAYFELLVSTISCRCTLRRWRIVASECRMAAGMGALHAQKQQRANFCFPVTTTRRNTPACGTWSCWTSCPVTRLTLDHRFGLGENGALGGPRTTGLEFKRRAVFEPTLTICGLDSGWQGSGAKRRYCRLKPCAKIDFRLIPDQDPEEVHRALRSHLDAHGYSDIEIRYLGGQRPARVDPDHPLVQLAAQTAVEVYGREADIIPMVGGSGPMWWFSNFLGMPVTSPGIEYPGVRVHSPNENIRLADYTNGTRHLARMLTRIDEAVAGNGYTEA